jgi:hypothetical protein
MIRVYQIKSQMFLIIMRISRIYLFFIVRPVRINMVPPLDHLIRYDLIFFHNDICG